nr:fasciclin-like arabinogalactan protein [Quercus suber]
MGPRLTPFLSLLMGSLALGQETITSTFGVAITTTTGESPLVSTITSSRLATVTGTAPINSAIPFPDAPTFVEAASSIDQVSSLVSLLKQDKFSPALTRLSSIGTALAPNNDAIAAFLETDAGQRFQSDDEFANAVLSYHALLGVFPASGFPTGDSLASSWFDTDLYNMTARPFVGGLADSDSVTLYSGQLEQSHVVEADLQFQNGYIHVIDTVLTVPEQLTSVLASLKLQALLGAIEASTLEASDLQKAGGITLFAPTDMAFENIGSLLDSLTSDNITDILSYHVLPEPVFLSDVFDGKIFLTLQGRTVRITFQDGDNGREAFVNGAKITMADRPTLNGVVHVIDQVLNPANFQGSPAGGDSVPQFSGATSTSVIPLTSAQPRTSASTGMPTDATGTPSDENGMQDASTSPLDNAGIPMATKAPVLGMVAAGVLAAML